MRRHLGRGYTTRVTGNEISQSVFGRRGVHRTVYSVYVYINTRIPSESGIKWFIYARVCIPIQSTQRTDITPERSVNGPRRLLVPMATVDPGACFITRNKNDRAAAAGPRAATYIENKDEEVEF